MRPMRAAASTRPEAPRLYRGLAAFLIPGLKALTRRDWRGAQNLPAGAFIAAPNHSSPVDPFTITHFLVAHGVYPRILVKAELATAPVIGGLLRRMGMVAVHRGGPNAASSLREAEAALAEGYAVLIYPEGTHTYDPNLWPMTAKTGAARLALTTGAPVIPIAQWGAHRFKWPHVQRWRPWRFTSMVAAGPPVNLDDLRARPLDDAVLREATSRIMGAITGELAVLRGEPAPMVLHDRRMGSRREATGS